jgi:hypothetical protein
MEVVDVSYAMVQHPPSCVRLPLRVQPQNLGVMEGVDASYAMVQHPSSACESRAPTTYSANNKVDENYYVQQN